MHTEHRWQLSKSAFSTLDLFDLNSSEFEVRLFTDSSSAHFGIYDTAALAVATIPLATCCCDWIPQTFPAWKLADF